jgi:hypothetical protein
MQPGINQRLVQRVVEQPAHEAAQRLRSDADAVASLERVGEMLDLAQRLEVAFFIPFGGFAGAPLLLTVLLATLAVTHTAMVGLWVLAVLAILFVVGTDIGVPAMVAVVASVGAVALTAWKWVAPRCPNQPWLLLVDTWLERIGRTILLLVATTGVVFVAWQVMIDKPGVLAPVYVFLYLLLLYPLFLALRIGLEPRCRLPHVRHPNESA